MLALRLPGTIAGRPYPRYLAASGMALGVDAALLLALLRMGVQPGPASALAYLAGIAVHWLVSTRFVFEDGMASRGAHRTRQKGLFVATALLGLGITTAVMTGAHRAGYDPILAKLVAVAVSFQITYLARRAAIFRA